MLQSTIEKGRDIKSEGSYLIQRLIKSPWLLSPQSGLVVVGSGKLGAVVKPPLLCWSLLPCTFLKNSRSTVVMTTVMMQSCLVHIN